MVGCGQRHFLKKRGPNVTVPEGGADARDGVPDRRIDGSPGKEVGERLKDALTPSPGDEPVVDEGYLEAGEQGVILLR